MLAAIISLWALGSDQDLWLLTFRLQSYFSFNFFHHFGAKSSGHLSFVSLPSSLQSNFAGLICVTQCSRTLFIGLYFLWRIEVEPLHKKNQLWTGQIVSKKISTLILFPHSLEWIDLFYPHVETAHCNNIFQNEQLMLATALWKSSISWHYVELNWRRLQLHGACMYLAPSYCPAEKAFKM